MLNNRSEQVRPYHASLSSPLCLLHFSTPLDQRVRPCVSVEPLKTRKPSTDSPLHPVLHPVLPSFLFGCTPPAVRLHLVAMVRVRQAGDLNACLTC